MIGNGKVEGRDVTFQWFRCGYYLTHSPYLTYAKGCGGLKHQTVRQNRECSQVVFIDEVLEKVEGMWSFKNGAWNFKSKCLVCSQSIEMEKSEKMDGIVHERVVLLAVRSMEGFPVLDRELKMVRLQWEGRANR